MGQIRQTVVLFLLLHVYIAFSALVFQHYEYRKIPKNGSEQDDMTSKFVSVCNLTSEAAARLIRETLAAKNEDRRDEMRESWRSFTSSVWFVMTLFTTVGKL